MFCIKWTAFVSWIPAHPLRSSISIQYLIYLTQHQYHKILIMSAPQIYLLHKRCTSTHASVLEMCHLVCQTLRFCFPGFFFIVTMFSIKSRSLKGRTRCNFDRWTYWGCPYAITSLYNNTHGIFCLYFCSIPNIVQWLFHPCVTCFLRLLRCCCNVAIQSAMLFTNF